MIEHLALGAAVVVAVGAMLRARYWRTRYREMAASPFTVPFVRRGKWRQVL